MEYLLALVPALCWGSIGLISGKIGGTAKQQTLGMVFGACTFALIFTAFNFKGFVSAATSESSIFFWLFGITSGFSWTIGQTFQFVAMKKLGISKAYPISTGAQLIVNCISGAFLFGEWRESIQIRLGISALFVLVLGIVLISIKDKNSLSKEDSDSDEEKIIESEESGKINANEEKKDLNIIRLEGIAALVLSTIGFCAQAIIVKVAEESFKIDSKPLVLPQGAGWLLGGIVFALRKNSFRKETFGNMITGISFGIGNLFLLISIANLGLAISFSFSQTGAIISTLGPIFLLGEKKTKKELVFAILGCVLIIVGAFLIGRIKGLSTYE